MTGDSSFQECAASRLTLLTVKNRLSYRKRTHGPDLHPSQHSESAGGAYVPTFFVGMYAPQLGV